MKIKAAIVDQKGAKFDIRDDVELADMQADSHGCFWNLSLR